MTTGKVVVVAGVGPGNGAALARRFAVDGARVAMLARDKERAETLAAEIDGARAYACDVSDEASVRQAFEAIRSELGEVDTLLYNAGSGAFADVKTITAEQFEAAWRVNALGAFLCSREVIPAMKTAGEGNIVFVGATASRRGSKMTAAFAPAKAAQRSLAESMARSLWPLASMSRLSSSTGSWIWRAPAVACLTRRTTSSSIPQASRRSLGILLASIGGHGVSRSRLAPSARTGRETIQIGDGSHRGLRC